MAGRPDFAAVLDYIGDTLAGISTTIGAGSTSVGPFGISGFRCLLVVASPVGGDLDITVNFQPTAVFTLTDNPAWAGSVRDGAVGIFAIPAFGARVDTVAFTGDTAGETLEAWVVGSNRDPLQANEVWDLIVTPGVTNVVAAAGTATIQLRPYAGPAHLSLSLPGTPWDARISSFDRLGNLVAEPWQGVAIAGNVNENIILPPRINNLTLTNNTGAGQTSRSTVVGRV